jgi:copper(I)-binding protein
MRLLSFALAATLALPATAHEFKVGDLHIDHPVARATTPLARATGGFLTITNMGNTPDRLIGVASDFAARSEVHLTANDNGVMRMREVDGIEIAPGATVELKPGSYHVMFMGIDGPLSAGETRDATLVFERAGEIDVTFNVETLSGGHAHGAKDAHNGHDHSSHN